MKEINIREFSRNMYSYLDDLPVAVYNSRTKTVVFLVISPEKGGEYNDIRTKNSIQPKRRRG